MAMLLSVVGMKWLAAEAMRAVLGYSRDEARVIFGLSVAQAAATLAATLVGYELGLLDDTVVNGAILMILVTCLAAPLIVFRYGRSLSRERSSEDPSIDRPQRVLVALSHPAGVDRLLELALLIHEKNQGQQVYPLSVIEESGGAADDVARAERMLSKAVLHLSAADVPASPVTRIDLSVPAGILRARRELRATEIVMGWAGRSTTTGFFFGSMLEKLLADAECSLIVGRLQQPVSASRRLLLLVPPNADQEPSFATTARLVARIARVLPVELVILGPEPAAEHARQRLIAASASLSPLLLRLSSWASLLQVLAEVAREGDLIVLGGVRSSTAMWRTPVGVLPGRIARRLPQQSLVLIYPAAPLHSHAPGTTLVPPGDETRLVTEHIVIGVHAATLDEAVGALITALPDIPPDEDTQPLADKLLASTEELAPNVVLMHTETELAQRSAVALGTSRRGIRHPRSARRAHVLVLLVEPPRQDAAGHLRNLAVVARAFYSPDVIERAKRATNAEELRELLRGR
jgi:nucleotide-binding universal stress UspA family protein